ncbi:hypothetical protein [Burkholderia ubonensis]|uniref:hypothetical protein n=1 Tax=Burkholderia ubonensis TaxID=101571 RepID=UPI00076DAAC7|nr:hypothetical protein [Burkholderia ubonensis]KVD97335.1 hypothetical protein WI90_32135 [Burkholderia ubonensis]
MRRDLHHRARAVNSVFRRVPIFYVGAPFVTMSIYPWDRIGTPVPGRACVPFAEREHRVLPLPATQRAGIRLI